MRNFLVTKCVYIVLFATMFFGFPVCAIVNWHDDPAISANVVDQNIDIQGSNGIIAPIYVRAEHQDVMITVTANDSIVTSSYQLYFYAAQSQRITVSCMYDLRFQGTNTDFLITFSGLGTLDFYVNGNHAVRFADHCAAGTKFFDIMSCVSACTAVRFSRMSAGGTNAYVQVGENSAISFAAATAVSSGSATERAAIFFDSTNTTTAAGRLVLQIEDGGSFIIAGHHITNLVNPTLADIDVTTPAGREASVHVYNADTASKWSGLMVVNRNKLWTNLKIDPFCENSYTQIRHGFVLGANGKFTTEDRSFLDYVVTITNVTVPMNINSATLNSPCPRFAGEITKDRNPAAFIVDGDTNAQATAASIEMLGHSALYFRSGVDCDGHSTILSTTIALHDQNLTFTINPHSDIKTEGTFVFDVEGLVNVTGQSTGESVLNVLSWEVTPTGGSVKIEGTDVVFPLRNFATDAVTGDKACYGSGCFFINNRMNLFNTAIKHDDQNHLVYENNIVAQSSPTYIGGDSASIGCSIRPSENAIHLYNSQFLVHTDVAFTGLDLCVSNTAIAGGNTSYFKVYYNGRCLDQGTGRQCILGTEVGSLASDFAHVLGRDAHIDVMQDYYQAAATDHVLTLTVAPNNQKVVQGLTGTITGQYSVNSIFLAYASNISIGTDGTQGTDTSGNLFNLITTPTFRIAGDYFAISTQGGTVKEPMKSSVTGEGGVFIDKNGRIDILTGFRASMGSMVTKSRNGSINLPKNQVLFAPHVGIAQWQLDLSDATQLEVIGSGENLSDYTMDWKNTTKKYCGSGVNVPWEPCGSPVSGTCPVLVHDNLTALPVIRGSIDQMQIKNSRIGDQASIVVDGGLVRELVFLPGNESAVAPVGMVVVQNDAIVGLGSAHRNTDSLDASMVLGVNGVTLVANGNGIARLNEDTLVNNVCHILTGTSFGVSGQQRFLIDSAVEREFRVKTGGVLDLTQFTSTNQQLVIGGEVHVVLEPGASVMLGGGDLIFIDQAILELVPFVDQDLPVGTTLAATNVYRVPFIGNGRVMFQEGSKLWVNRGSLVGIETNPSLNVTETSQQWIVEDDAQLFVGRSDVFGGGFQVGNIQDYTDNVVTFTLKLNGTGAHFEINSQGFIGFGVGIVNKTESAPNNWRVDRLFNLESVTLNFAEGTFNHQQIFSGANDDASLLALGPVTNNYFLSYFITSVNLLGGGNLINVGTGTGWFNPIVLTTDGVISARYSAGILSSLATLLDRSKTPENQDPFTAITRTLSASDMFTYLKMNNYVDQMYKTATIFRSNIGEAIVGYIDDSVIYREWPGVIRSGASEVSPDRALLIGAAGLSLSNPPNRTPSLAILNP